MLKPDAANEKVRAHREKLRAQGLHPMQIWVPDTRSDAFRAEASRQMKILSNSKHAAEDQAFVDTISEWPSD